MKKAGSRIYTFLIFLFLYAPILVLIVFSFNDTETASRTVWSGFSLKSVSYTHLTLPTN